LTVYVIVYVDLNVCPSVNIKWYNTVDRTLGRTLHSYEPGKLKLNFDEVKPANLLRTYLALCIDKLLMYLEIYHSYKHFDKLVIISQQRRSILETTLI